MPIQAKVGKSTLSMYLRTNCDRELYHSLYKSNSAGDLVASGMPAPLSARPNIQIITKAGVEFEEQEYDMLLAIMGSAHVKHDSSKSKKFADLDLASSLSTFLTPGFYLQPAIDVELFRVPFLCDDLGLSSADENIIPTLAGMRPDMVIARHRKGLQWEVLPSGKRRLLDPIDDRIALSVVDIKNTLEGNKSYAAEVVLYSIILSKYLTLSHLSGNYFVSDECFLWTNNEKSVLAALPPTATIDNKLEALLQSLEKIEFAVMAPSVVKFFTEDLLRVLKKANADGWQAVEYHVGPLCSNCDWLGYERWLSTNDKALFHANPAWYCTHAAEVTDHLSRMPNLSRGARQVLEGGKVLNLTGLSALAPGDAILKSHSLLKRERSNISHRAQAILTKTPSVDTSATLSGLANWVDFMVSISVNFDAAAGLLTGISSRATLFTPSAVKQLGVFEAVVEFDTISSEWHALFSFLNNLVIVINQAEREFGSTPKTQLYFWEHRQFQELCAAVGRHLPEILDPANHKLLRALAWLFPPDELMRSDGAISPYIIFVGELAQRVLRTTAPHAFTLRTTFENYHLTSLPPRYVDLYYLDPLGNGIPRERIYEVWKNTGNIRSGAVIKTKTQAAIDYGKALQAQCLAIMSIAGKLREDFRSQLKGTAKKLSLVVPSGATGVAFDSKLWITWAEVSAITATMERKAEFTLPAEVLESSYKALVLTSFISRNAAGSYEFDVNPESSETKIEEGDGYLVLGDASRPGFPIETPKSLGLVLDPIRHGNAYQLPIWSLIRVQLVNLDREKLKAEIRILPRNANSTGAINVISDLISNGLLPLSGNLFLMEGKPYDDSSTVDSILRAVRNPKFATPDPLAIRAMGRSSKIPTGNDPATPLAKVLWQADDLTRTAVRSSTQGQEIAKRAKYFSGSKLDDSQEKAIYELSQKQLSLVWGPPGTGKTSTLVAYLLAVIEEAILAGSRKKIFISGPNYRAVEVLIHKLFKDLSKQVSLPVDLFIVYSRSRPVVALPFTPPSHLNAKAVSLGDPGDSALLKAAFDSLGVSIYGTSAHTGNKLAETVTGLSSTLIEAFDLVIIDESSQVPLTLALNPLSTLKHECEIVIAGDPKQMPPIHSLDPPAGAEHLVGSIHSYLKTRFSITEQELLYNYRSGKDLVEFAKTLGYPIGLQAKFPDLQIQLLTSPNKIVLPSGLPPSAAWAKLLEPEKVVAAVLHDDSQSSQANLAEARMVAALAYTLRYSAAQELATLNAGSSLTPFTDEEFLRTGLGIVTPHKAQRALILAELHKLFPTVTYNILLECVDTVERFQGGERHTIIVSFGVGDVDVIQGEEEFLLQMERANVAISRAMAKCIVLMPKTLAYHLPDDSKVARTAAALKSYLEEFCFNRASYPVAGTSSIEIRWR